MLVFESVTIFLNSAAGWHAVFGIISATMMLAALSRPAASQPSSMAPPILPAPTRTSGRSGLTA